MPDDLFKTQSFGPNSPLRSAPLPVAEVFCGGCAFRCGAWWRYFRPITRPFHAAFGNAYEEIELHFDVTVGLANIERRGAGVSIRHAHEVIEDVVGPVLVHCTKAVYCVPEYAAKVEDNGG